MGHFNIEFGLLCAGADEEEELAQLSVCLCWEMYGADPRGFQQIDVVQCYERKSDCRVTCTRRCDDEQGERLHASAVGARMGASRSWTSCCDPKWCLAQRFIFNKHKLCSTWDHFLVKTVVEKKDGHELHFQQKIRGNKKLDAWCPRDEEAKAKYRWQVFAGKGRSKPGVFGAASKGDRGSREVDSP